MRFFKSLAIVVHTLFFIAVGGFLIVLSADVLPPDELMNNVNILLGDPTTKIILGAIGAVCVVMGLILARINLGKINTERTIAFENPEGQVTVSLSAIEDYIKKSVHHLGEVKELRSRVTASKKGIDVTCKAIIFANSNIPETTEKIQSIVKSKVQDMLGVEESINIRIHITKISSGGGGRDETVEQPKEFSDTSRRMPLGE